MMNRIDLVNLTGKMLSFELPHKVVCRALGVCQCRNHAAPSINIAKKSALTNRPGEYALAPAIIEACNAGELRIKERTAQRSKPVQMPAVQNETAVETEAPKTTSSRRYRDKA
jgi:hypothetical protein